MLLPLLCFGRKKNRNFFLSLIVFFFDLTFARFPNGRVQYNVCVCIVSIFCEYTMNTQFGYFLLICSATVNYYICSYSLPKMCAWLCWCSRDISQYPHPLDYILKYYFFTVMYGSMAFSMHGIFCITLTSNPTTIQKQLLTALLSIVYRCSLFGLFCLLGWKV